AGLAAALEWAAVLGWPPRWGGRRARRPLGSEQGQFVAFNAAQAVVVDDDAADAAVLGEDAGLGLDLLGGEHSGDRGQQRVAAEQLEVPGQLLDTVDLAPALDLYGHARAGGVPAEQVDGADGGRVLTPDQGEPVAQCRRRSREQLLQ